MDVINNLTALLITKTYSLQEKKMYPAREHKALSVFFIMIFFGSFHLDDDGAFILAVASIYDEKYVRKYLVVVLGHLSNVKHFRISPIWCVMLFLQITFYISNIFSLVDRLGKQCSFSI